MLILLKIIPSMSYSYTFDISVVIIVKIISCSLFENYLKLESYTYILYINYLSNLMDLIIY